MRKVISQIGIQAYSFLNKFSTSCHRDHELEQTYGIMYGINNTRFLQMYTVKRRKSSHYKVKTQKQLNQTLKTQPLKV